LSISFELSTVLSYYNLVFFLINDLMLLCNVNCLAGGRKAYLSIYISCKSWR